MDWASTIERNQAALTRIVATLIAMVEMGTGSMAALLPPSLYREVSRMLLPVESAVRRLIAMAARGLKVTLAPPRPMPKGIAFSGKAGGGGVLAFQLFDTRQRFSRKVRRRAASRSVPRIHIFDDSPLIPLYFRQPVESPAPKPDAEPDKPDEPDNTIDATRLGRRLSAVKMALENLPQQAKRLARWKARRRRMQKPAFLSPLRPGPPPGHRKEAIDEIDFILRVCHTQARDALLDDTS